MISLFNATIPGNSEEILNVTVSAALGLPPWPEDIQGAPPDGEGDKLRIADAVSEHQRVGGAQDGLRRKLRAKQEFIDIEAELGGSGVREPSLRPLEENGAGDSEEQIFKRELAEMDKVGDEKTERRARVFDISVLCTAVSDVNHLLKVTYPVDPRLVDALLWNVEVRHRGREGGRETETELMWVIQFLNRREISHLDSAFIVRVS